MNSIQASHGGNGEASLAAPHLPRCLHLDPSRLLAINQKGKGRKKGTKSAASAGAVVPPASTS